MIRILVCLLGIASLCHAQGNNNRRQKCGDWECPFKSGANWYMDKASAKDSKCEKEKCANNDADLGLCCDAYSCEGQACGILTRVAQTCDGGKDDKKTEMTEQEQEHDKYGCWFEKWKKATEEDIADNREAVADATAEADKQQTAMDSAQSQINNKQKELERLAALRDQTEKEFSAAKAAIEAETAQERGDIKTLTNAGNSLCEAVDGKQDTCKADIAHALAPLVDGSAKSLLAFNMPPANTEAGSHLVNAALTQIQGNSDSLNDAQKTAVNMMQTEGVAAYKSSSGVIMGIIKQTITDAVFRVNDNHNQLTAKTAEHESFLSTNTADIKANEDEHAAQTQSLDAAAKAKEVADGKLAENTANLAANMQHLEENSAEFRAASHTYSVQMHKKATASEAFTQCIGFMRNILEPKMSKIEGQFMFIQTGSVDARQGAYAALSKGAKMTQSTRLAFLAAKFMDPAAAGSNTDPMRMLEHELTVYQKDVKTASADLAQDKENCEKQIGDIFREYSTQKTMLDEANANKVRADRNNVNFLDARTRIVGNEENFAGLAADVKGKAKKHRTALIRDALKDAADRMEDATKDHMKYKSEKEEIMQGLKDARHAVEAALAKNNQAGLLQAITRAKVPAALLQQADSPFAKDNESGRKKIKKTDGKKENAVVGIINGFIEDEEEESTGEQATFDKFRSNYKEEKTAYSNDLDANEEKANKYAKRANTEAERSADASDAIETAQTGVANAVNDHDSNYVSACQAIFKGVAEAKCPEGSADCKDFEKAFDTPSAGLADDYTSKQENAAVQIAALDTALAFIKGGIESQA